MLGKINSEDLRFTGNLDSIGTNTYLTLEDSDWTNYKLSSSFTTDEYGILDVEFLFYGSKNSAMDVKQTKKNATKEFNYEYSTDIFKKYITRFLTNHIASWDSKSAFNGEGCVLDFYNDVIENGKLK